MEDEGQVGAGILVIQIFMYPGLPLRKDRWELGFPSSLMEEEAGGSGCRVFEKEDGF